MKAPTVGYALLHKLVADRAGVDREVVERVLEAYGTTIQAVLAEGAKVRFLDGHLIVIKTKATRRFNPKHGGLVEVPEREKIVYKIPKKR